MGLWHPLQVWHVQAGQLSLTFFGDCFARATMMKCKHCNFSTHGLSNYCRDFLMHSLAAAQGMRFGEETRSSIGSLKTQNAGPGQGAAKRDARHLASEW